MGGDVDGAAGPSGPGTHPGGHLGYLKRIFRGSLTLGRVGHIEDLAVLGANEGPAGAAEGLRGAG